MSGGIIIQQRAEIKQAVGPGTANFSRLPPQCQAQVTAICQKGLADWTDYDTAYMASMPMVAIHC